MIQRSGRPTDRGPCNRIELLLCHHNLEGPGSSLNLHLCSITGQNGANRVPKLVTF